MRDHPRLPTRPPPKEIVIWTTVSDRLRATKAASGGKPITGDEFTADTAASIRQRTASDGHATAGEDCDEGQSPEQSEFLHHDCLSLFN
jgi:hypothetical protein